MISHRHRCIYVKVPKCASSSVHEWFLAHGAGHHAWPGEWYPGSLAERLPPLARALELWPGYFAFTFMRNPYRRFVSVYLQSVRLARAQALAHPDRPPSPGTLREFAELCGELLAETRHLWGPQARAFRREHGNRRYGPRGHPLRHLRFVAVHARPQVDFLPNCNPEALFGVPRPRPAPLSFIGTVETLDVDFRRLRALLGLPPAPLPRHNASEAAPETLERLRGEPATRALIEHLYAEDFAFAGYPLGQLEGPADGRLGPAEGSSAPRSGSALRSSSADGGPVVLARRALFALRSAEIDLEARFRPIPALRRVLAPMARLRRRID